MPVSLLVSGPINLCVNQASALREVTSFGLVSPLGTSWKEYRRKASPHPCAPSFKAFFHQPEEEPRVTLLARGHAGQRARSRNFRVWSLDFRVEGGTIETHLKISLLGPKKVGARKTVEPSDERNQRAILRATEKG